MCKLLLPQISICLMSESADNPDKLVLLGESRDYTINEIEQLNVHPKFNEDLKNHLQKILKDFDFFAYGKPVAITMTVTMICKGCIHSLMMPFSWSIVYETEASKEGLSQDSLGILLAELFAHKYIEAIVIESYAEKLMIEGKASRGTSGNTPTIFSNN